MKKRAKEIETVKIITKAKKKRKKKKSERFFFVAKK